MSYDKSLANPEMVPGAPPQLNFRYNFSHSFPTLVNAQLLKHNWESRNALTTISHVQQIDDDRVLYYRRLQSTNTYGHTWEQVIINRATQTIETEVVGPNLDLSRFTVEKQVIQQSGDGATVNTYVYDTQGNGTAKIEVFKNQCIQLLKAIQFQKWSTQE